MRYIQRDRNRWKTGAVLAAAALLLMGFRGDWLIGAGLAALFLGTGFLKIQTQQPGSAFFLNVLWALACIVLSCCYPSWMMEYRFLDVGYVRVVLNFACTAAVYGFVLVFTGRIRPAAAIASGLLLLLNVVNVFVFRFRGTELQPTDILSAGTALNVAAGYTFTLPVQMARCLALWLWTVFAFGALPKEPVFLPRRWLRAAAAVATAACVFLFGWKGANVRPGTWSNEGTLYNGYLLNFCVGLRDSFIEKPEGYSPEGISRLEETYPAQEAALPETLPDIVVIMDESLADFRVLGDGLNTNQPVTPFLDSLTENTARGFALTTVFGGGTANAEFELLTGCSMAFLPRGTIAYQQYLRQEVFSLPRLLESYGYDTAVTHPYFSNGWNRTKAYPLLGFQEMTFLDDYPQQDLIRDFVSDREMFDYVLNRLNRQGEAPLFLFGITMQNHGDYNYETYESTISLEGERYPMAEQYLSLIHETDEAVEYLLTELEKSSRDTVVLLFGDHFPQVEGDFFQAVHGGSFDTLPERMLQYQVPFYLWANFDIPEQTTELTSLNYLAIKLLETAGLPLPSYYRFLSDMQQVIPALNPYGFYTNTGEALEFNQAEGDPAQWLSLYEAMQYNCLFDKDGRSRVFFP
ncbi:MAG: LTA synthase family protein [Faecousia sp.]